MRRVEKAGGQAVVVQIEAGGAGGWDGGQEGLHGGRGEVSGVEILDEESVYSSAKGLVYSAAFKREI